MPFRKRRFVRRRRPGANMIPLSICSNDYLAPSGTTCIANTASAFALDPLHGSEFLQGAGMTTADRLSATTVRKELYLMGMRFYWGTFQVNYPPLAFYRLAVRAAVCLLEVNPSGAPSVAIPNLFSKHADEVGDVLWRGAALIRGQNDASCDGDICADSYAGSALVDIKGNMDGATLPVVVKTKRRIKDTQALFFVIQCHNPLTSGNDITMGLELFGVAAVRSRQT